MAIDTENKRRSATGIFSLFTVFPVADGTIDSFDRVHSTFIYSGITIIGGSTFFEYINIKSLITKQVDFESLITKERNCKSLITKEFDVNSPLGD